MKVILATVLIIGLVGIASLTFANAKTVSPKINSEKNPASAGDVEIKDYQGTIMKTEDNKTLLVGKSTYILEGKNLESLIAKTVKVSGKLIKGETTSTILVAKVEETK